MAEGMLISQHCTNACEEMASRRSKQPRLDNFEEASDRRAHMNMEPPAVGLVDVRRRAHQWCDCHYHACSNNQS